MSEFKHQVSIQLRFNDIDGLGHVNNAVQANYFDFGRLQYFEAIYNEPIEWRKFPMVIASVKTDFFIPIFLSDKISVCTHVKNIGEKSLLMYQELKNAKGETLSTCESVMVGFDIKLQKSAEISSAIKSLIQNFEG